MSFKDKKPEFFRMGSGDNLVYSVGAVDEYLAIVEPMAEKWDQYAIYDNDNEPKILVKDLITAYETLEAVKELAVKLLAWSDDGVSWMFSEAPGEKKGDRIEYAELTKEFRELLGIKVDCEEGP